MLDLDKIFKTFLNMFGESSYSKSDYDSYQESVVDGKRHVTYGFNGDYDHEKMKGAIIKAMAHWCNFVTVSDDFDSFVITFVFDGKECFHFTWDKETKRFLTEDPDGTVFAYNFATGTIEQCNPISNTQCNHEEDNEKKNNSIDFCVPENKCDEELPKNKNLASVIKERIESYDKTYDINPCDGCESLFCPVKAIDMFINNIQNNTNYASLRDEDGNVTGLVTDVIELISDDVEFPLDMSNIDIYNKLYHDESDLLDAFCEDFVELYGFTKCYWVANKDEIGNVVQLTVNWVF